MKHKVWTVLFAFASLIALSSCRYSRTYFNNRLGDLGRRTYGIPWNPFIKYGTLVDHRDGHIYRTVKIGKQTWMAENLDFDVGNNEAKCPGDSVDSCAKYGRMYQWEAAMKIGHIKRPVSENMIDPQYYYRWGGSDQMHQGICPDGWHLPSITEWLELMAISGGDSTAGTTLKSQRGWGSSVPQKVKGYETAFSENGNDSYGFRALHVNRSSFMNTFFWSATEAGPTPGWSVKFTQDPAMFHLDALKSGFFGIRCLKN